MELIQAVALGTIQGLTEFLPVSSSGHLVLLQNLFGLKEPELLFDIAVHVGTLVAVLLVFFKDLLSIARTLLQSPALIRRSGGFRALYGDNADIRMVSLIVMGSIPTALLGVFFQGMIDQLFGTVALVGVMLLVTGGLLWLTRTGISGGRALAQMTVKDALIVGFVQGLAITPGISRSGSTIAVALMLGVGRETAGRYSFLLSIPAIVGALVLGLHSSIARTETPALLMLLGSLTAAAVGYGALKLLLQVVRQGRLHFFSPYCWLLGLLALVWGVAF